MKKHKIRLAATSLALVTLTAACGSNDPDVGRESTSPSTSTSSESPSASPSPSEMAEALIGQAAVQSAASETRAALTAELEEHVYLAGIATGTALEKGPDSPEFEAAAGALDQNSVELSEIVGSVYGDAGAEQFLDLWRKHIGFFVDYTVGAATEDAAAKEKARADLDGYRADFGAFIESATEGALPKDAVAEELKVHVESLTKAIDAQAAKDPKQFELLKEAAGHMPMTAATLAGGIAEQKQLEG